MFSSRITCNLNKSYPVNSDLSRFMAEQRDDSMPL